jgi:hypothetical protein
MVNEGLIKSVQFMSQKGIGVKRIASEVGIGIGTVYTALDA